MEIEKVIVYLIYDILKRIETVKLHFIFSWLDLSNSFIEKHTPNHYALFCSVDSCSLEFF